MDVDVLKKWCELPRESRAKFLRQLRIRIDSMNEKELDRLQSLARIFSKQFYDLTLQIYDLTIEKKAQLK